MKTFLWALFFSTIIVMGVSSCSDDEPYNEIPWYEDTEVLRLDYAKALIDA